MRFLLTFLALFCSKSFAGAGFYLLPRSSVSAALTVERARAHYLQSIKDRQRSFLQDFATFQVRNGRVYLEVQDDQISMEDLNEILAATESVGVFLMADAESFFQDSHRMSLTTVLKRWTERPTYPRSTGHLHLFYAGAAATEKHEALLKSAEKAGLDRFVYITLNRADKLFILISVDWRPLKEDDRAFLLRQIEQVLYPECETQLHP